MDLSQVSDEDLMKMKAAPVAAASSGVDLSKLSNEDLMKLRAGAPSEPAISTFGHGILKVAAGIGSTLMWPLDATGLTERTHQDRVQALDSFFKANDDTASPVFKAGELAGSVAGTAGTGGILAKGVMAAGRVAPAIAQFAPKLASALESGGISLGNAAPASSFAGKVANAATRVGAGATVGGASAGLVDPSTAGEGAAVGAALPVVAKGLGMAGKALAGDVSPEVATLYQKAKDLGIDIPADRIVNSRPLNAVASSLNYVPFSGRAGTEEKMVSQMNRALSRTFGQDSDNVTQALRKAGDDLGGKFDAVLQNNKVKVDNQFLTDLVNHTQTAADELSPDGARIIGRQIDNILEKAGPNGEIDGQAAYNIKKTLDRIGARNSSEAFYAREVKKSLMGALNRSLGPQEAADFAKVRQQYGTMLDLENLAQNGAEGGISVGRLANLKNIKNPDLQDLADIAAQFVKSRESPHGAAQRVAMGTLGAGAGMLSPTAAPAIAGGVVAARTANTALNSPALKALLLNQGAAGARASSFGGNPALRALLYNAPQTNQ